MTNTIAPNTELLVDVCKGGTCWKQHKELIPQSDVNNHLDHTWFTCGICNTKLPSLLFIMKHTRFCNNAGTIITTVAETNEADAKTLMEQIKPCLVFTTEKVNTNISGRIAEKNMCKCTKSEKSLICSCGLSNIKLEERESKVCKSNEQTQGEHSVTDIMHIKSEGRETIFSCHECKNTFSSSFNLNNHLKRHTKKTKCNFDRAYKCDECSKSFTLKRLLRTHLKIHTKGISPRCDKLKETCKHCGYLPHSCMELHMKIHTDENKYKCNQCKSSFVNKSSLKIHMNIHLGILYECHPCGKLFYRKTVLKVHLMTKHSEEKSYKCTLCNASFRHSNSLIVHTRTHTGEKPYKCTQCGSCFSQSPHLKSHMRIHTGVKPYKCDQCGKEFRQSSHLKLHIKIHHLGEKPCKCKICGTTFSLPHTLKTHLRVHTGEKPYTCYHCNHSCSQRSALMVHIRSQHMEMPYICKICRNSFSSPKSLKTHMQTHKTCKPCGKSFSEMKKFLAHMKTHSRKDNSDVNSLTQPNTRSHLKRSKKC